MASPISVNTAAERMGISPSMVRSLIARGDLPHFKIGRAVRLDPADVDRYLAACYHAPPQPGPVNGRRTTLDVAGLSQVGAAMGPRQLAMLRRNGVGTGGG
jgi:excisionase family DNA binding protein